jgi:hypothetical protein
MRWITIRFRAWHAEYLDNATDAFRAHFGGSPLSYVRARRLERQRAAYRATGIWHYPY